MGSWSELPLKGEVFQNLDETVLRRTSATLENAYINEAGAHSRFPGLVKGQTLPGGGKVYLNEWRGDLMASTSAGRVYRLDGALNYDDVTLAVPTGGQRIIFARTENQLMMAAGGPIVQFAGDKTQILSVDAPDTTHVAFLSGFALAPIRGSQIWQYSSAGEFTDWPALNTFSAESRPDNITALLVTEYGEALFAGPDSIEQFEAYPGGDRPFFRRWSVGEGLIAPYSLIAADAGIWGINRLREFVRLSGQQSKPESTQMSLVLESVDDFTDAWAALMHLFGQKFIVLSFPFATSPYGLKGMTLLYDYRNKRWSFIFGWDDELGIPAAWPGISYYALAGKHYVGGMNGEIYTLERTAHANDGMTQRVLWRSAHFDERGLQQIHKIQFRCKRGAIGNTTRAQMRLRCRRDNRHWDRWQVRDLGVVGDTDFGVDFGAQGTAQSFQFEYAIFDACPIEIVSAQALVEPVSQ